MAVGSFAIAVVLAAMLFYGLRSAFESFLDYEERRGKRHTAYERIKRNQERRRAFLVLEASILSGKYDERLLSEYNQAVRESLEERA